MSETSAEALEAAEECSLEDGPGGVHPVFTPHRIKRIALALDAFAARRVAEATAWRPIETAPRDGSEIELFIPYDRSIFSVKECESYGYWDGHCFRHKGDDGPDDIQPTHWRHPFPPPEGK